MTRSKEVESAPPWEPVVSGNAQLVLSAVNMGLAPALRMDFDFKGGGGFVVARRAWRRAMPEDFAVRFRLRGRGPVNQLELKLVDATGQNVWRHVQKDLRPPPRWKRMRVDSRSIDFAWGPASGSRLSSLGSIEFALVAGEGGKGTLWIADVQIEDCDPTEPPRLSASSALPQFGAANALTGAGWKPRPDDRHPWICIDSSRPRVIGGLIIDWLERAPAAGFRLRTSNGGVRFKTVHAAKRAGGKRSYVYLPDTRARMLRLEPGEPAPVAALRPQPFEFSRSIHAFWHAVAEAEKRGWHPRWLYNQQSLWTPFGRSDGTQCALMNADGMVEVGQGSFSVEPMMWIEGSLITWAEVTPRQELRDGWMPVPAVIWESAQWRLRIEAEATVSGASRVRYRFENLTDRPIAARLFVLLRPFQVTPPWQSFRGLGGVSRIFDLQWRDGAVLVNDAALIVPAAAPLGFAAMCFDEGFMASHLEGGTLPGNAQAHDPFGFATGALAFDTSVEAGQSVEHVLTGVPGTAAAGMAAAVDMARAGEPAFDWGSRVRAGQWAGPGWAAQAIQAALSATAQILVTRSGPALQPGPRRYTRSWIRDGAMMSAALLRMGHAAEVREYIRWYAPHQRADGFVPCCVDGEGPDWLVEHDSHGELLALIGDYHRFAADRELLLEMWPRIVRTVSYIEALLGADGLLPISVSHEGYLAQPVHSYWDDFWALRGLRDAVQLARAAGHEAEARQWAMLDARLSHALFASIEATRARRALDFIPGSIEWADFDPTATANAIYLLDVPDGLNRGAVERTFDKYLADWRGKRDGTVPWTNYTPYEIRIIGALVRLGRREAALELLRFFLSDRRPPPWNQWPEIAWRDREAPAHVGDLPHTWIAAEYVLAVRSLFAYEREADQSLVLAAGLAPEWLDGAGVQVTGMPTARGSLSYSLRRVDAGTLRFELGGGADLRGKMVLRPPLPAALRAVTVDGSPHSQFDAESVTLTGPAAQVVCMVQS